jgi:HK97 family phage major capsid protein
VAQLTQFTIEEAADEAGLQVEEIRALQRANVLVGAGRYISAASLSRYLRTRAKRNGKWLFAVIERGVLGQAASPETLRILGAAAETITTERSDAGTAVPVTYADEIMSLILDDVTIPGRCRTVVTPSNNWTAPVDRRPGHDTSKGIVAKFEGETDEIEQTKAALEVVSGKLSKLTALVPISDEMMEDAIAFGDYVTDAAGRAIAYALTDAIIRGTGVP